MELLFKNKTILSKENYMNLVEFHQKKNNWKYWLYTATFSILLIVCLSFQIAMKNYLLIFILSVFLIAFVAYRFIQPYYKTKKELESEKIQKNLTNFYFFYDKYFKVKNKIGSSKLKYYQLYKVYENEKYFYLYIDKTNSFILEKTGFEVGDEKGFRGFMKKKFPLKFKVEREN